MTLDIRILTPGDAHLLERVAPDVFDEAVDARWSAEFLTDPRHHIAAAVEDGVVVGFASGVHYVHPDKAPELWVDEVGVAPTHQGRGLGKRVLAALLAHGRALGCVAAWVLTEHDNTAARRLYSSLEGQEMTELVMYTFPLE